MHPKPITYDQFLEGASSGRINSHMGRAKAGNIRDTVALARNLEAEAGNQGRVGKEAVANTVLNRMKNRGMSAHDVVWQPKQYSWTNDPNHPLYKRIMAHGHGNRSKDPGFRESYEIAEDMVHTGAPVDSQDALPDVMSADHYLAPKSLKRLPSWAGKMKKLGVVGDHHFYDSKQKPQRYGTGMTPTSMLRPGSL